MITEETRELVDDTIVLREIDLIRVIGNEASVRVYELMGNKETLAADRLELGDTFEQAISAYRNMQLDQARTHFET